MPKSVLIVDDSRSMRELLTYTLSSNNYKVSEAPDAESAFQQVCLNRFDLIITDLNMGALDGLGLIKKIRALPSYARTPVLMLTTDSNPATRDKARAAGATGWLVKPFDPVKLLETLARVVP